VLNQQPEITVRETAPRTRRKMSPMLAYGLIPAAGAVSITLLAGMFTAPPRFVARAAFVVDWNAEPGGSITGTTSRDNRTMFITQMASLPHSEPELSELLEGTPGRGGNPADQGVALGRLQRYLRVTRTAQSDQEDGFAIETMDDDPGTAQAAANWVLEGAIAKLRDGANAGSAAVGWRSLAEVGAGSHANLIAMPAASPVKAVNEAQVQARSFGYGLRVLLASLALGAVAGGAGLLLRQFILGITALKIVVEDASRRMRLESSTRAELRDRRRAPSRQRPILLRPLPQLCVAEQQPEADGWSSPQI